MKKILSLDLKYSAMQMCYYATCVLISGYASVYLLNKGFSNSIIGVSLSIVNILSIFVQTFVSSFCDNHPKIDVRNVITAISGSVMVLAFAIRFCGSGNAMLLCVFIALYTIVQTICPLVNALAFAFEKYGISINFGLGRGLGSATYAIVSLIVGYITEAYGVDILPLGYLLFCVIQIFTVRLYVLPKTERKAIAKEEKLSVSEEEEKSQLSFLGFLLAYKKFTVFCFGATMVYFTHIISVTYMIQIITPLGGTESMMGVAIFIACLMELPAMAVFERLRRRWGCKNVMILSMITSILKNVLTLLAVSVPMLYGVQLLQFFEFGLFFPATVYYGKKVVPKRDMVKAQTLVTLAYNISAIYASLIGGILLDLSGVSMMLMVGILFSVLGLIVCTLFSEKC